MARQSLKTQTTTNDLVVNTGTSVNSKDGDPLRSAFNKLVTSINRAEANFIELYDQQSAEATTTDTIVNGDYSVSVGTDGVVSMVTSRGTLEFGALPEPGGPSHFHIMRAAGQDTSMDLFFGDDFNYVRQPADYGQGFGVEISASNHNTQQVWQFNTAGTLNTPAPFPLSFTAVLDSDHMVQGVALTDTPWQFEVSFVVDQNGDIETQLDQPFPNPSNPGYVSGYEFIFEEADHGIPGYTFSLLLSDVVLPGGAGWTANPEVSPAPAYPSTLNTTGVLKLHSDTVVVLESGSGVHKEQFKFIARNLILPGNGDIKRVDQNGDLVSVLLNLNNYQAGDVDIRLETNNSIVMLVDGVTGIDASSDGLRLYANNSDIQWDGTSLIIPYNSVIGNSETEVVVQEDVGGTTTQTTVNQSQIEIAGTGFTIAKRTVVTIDDGVITSVDNRGSELQVTNTGAFIKHYEEPEGPNNSVFSQFTTVGGATIESVEENITYTDFGRVVASTGSVEVHAGSNGSSNQWVFNADGTLSLPENGDIIDSNGASVLGGAPASLQPVPTTRNGQAGDKAGMMAIDQQLNYVYICKTDYTSGAEIIWVRIQGDTAW